MSIKFKTLSVLIEGIIISTCLVNPLKSQSLIQCNPADIADSRSFFLNPATIPYQPPQLVLAMKVFHFGFFDNDKYGLRNHFLGLSVPGVITDQLGVGITGQSFNSEYYNQTNFSVALSQPLTSIISIGAKLNLFNKSYHLAPFESFDPNDPVFAQGTSKTTLSYGAGIFAIPISNFSFGLCFDHINQPDISLVNAKVKQPMTTDIGFKYTYKFLSFASNINYTEQNLSTNFCIETLLFDMAKFRIGYGSEVFKIETQFYLFKGMSFNYHWDYPFNELSQVSSGSHEIGIIYNFDWFFKSGFEVNSRVRTLKLSRHSKTIIIDKDITANDLNSISESDLAFTSSLESIDSYNKEVSRLLSEVKTDSEMVSRLTPRYRYSIDQISYQLENRKDIKVELIIPEGTEERALTIKNRMTKDWGVSENKIKLISVSTPLDSVETDTIGELYSISKLDSIREVLKYQKNQQLVIKENFPEDYSHDSTIFYIKPINRKKPIKRWQLIIERKNSKPIRIFSGWKLLPSQISWNWLDENFEFIKPGTYFYYLKWQDANDQLHQTARKILSVQKHHTNVTLLLTKESKEEELKDKTKNVIGYQILLHENNLKKNK